MRMNKIFLNDPKTPKDEVFFARVALIILLLASQIALFVFVFMRSDPPLPAETSISQDRMVQTLPVQDEEKAMALSLPDTEEGRAAEAFFGPLPNLLPGRPPLKSIYPVKGIYIGQGRTLDEALQLAKSTEVNAVVIDVKESWGLSYQSKVPLAVEMKASAGALNLSEMFRRCHDAGVHVIARMVCFKDEVMCHARPDLCIRDEEGNLLRYELEGGASFVNPYLPENWNYLIDLAKEVISFGADEIQFDYVRFPTGSPEGEKPPRYSKQGGEPAKEFAINRFLETARVELQENMGIPVTADLFSIVMTSRLDGELIGQDWDRIGLTGINAICPMIYPSHYANASFGNQGNGVGSYIGKDFFEAPDLHPYDVVINAFIDGGDVAELKSFANLRPWLQAFTAEYLAPGFYIPYGAAEVREQIRAVYESGYAEWLLWNAEYVYPEEFFLSESEGMAEASLLESARAVHEAEQAVEESLKAEETTRRFPIATAPKP